MEWLIAGLLVATACGAAWALRLRGRRRRPFGLRRQGESRRASRLADLRRPLQTPRGRWEQKARPARGFSADAPALARRRAELQQVWSVVERLIERPAARVQVIDPADGTLAPEEAGLARVTATLLGWFRGSAVSARAETRPVGKRAWLRFDLTVSMDPAADGAPRLRLRTRARSLGRAVGRPANEAIPDGSGLPVGRVTDALLAARPTGDPGFDARFEVRAEESAAALLGLQERREAARRLGAGSRFEIEAAPGRASLSWEGPVRRFLAEPPPARDALELLAALAAGWDPAS